WIERYRLPADRWLPVQQVFRCRRRLLELWRSASRWERVGNHGADCWDPALGSDRHLRRFGEVACKGLGIDGHGELAVEPALVVVWTGRDFRFAHRAGSRQHTGPPISGGLISKSI